MTTRNSSKPGTMEPGPPPTDLELMLYADGELEESRAREVEAHVLRDARCRAKIAGLEITGAAIRERATPSIADGIADAVMARLHEEGSNGVDPPHTAKTTAKNAAKKAVNGVAPLATVGGEERRGAPRVPERRPANDNARRIFVLAAVAAAAAAGLMIWGRTESGLPQAKAPAPAPTEVAVAPTPAPAEAPAGLAPGDDAEPGVEIAAVDFGARMGTIFYIPTGASETSPTTAVVWLSDELTGGER